MNDFRAQRIGRKERKRRLRDETEEMNRALEALDRLDATDERVAELEVRMREIAAQVAGFDEIFRGLMIPNGEDTGYR